MCLSNLFWILKLWALCVVCCIYLYPGETLHCLDCIHEDRDPKKKKKARLTDLLRRPVNHSGFYNQMDGSLTKSLETKLAKAFSSDKSLVHKGVGWGDVGHLGRERNGRQTLYVSHPGFTKERIIKVSAAGAHRKWNIMSKELRGALMADI